MDTPIFRNKKDLFDWLATNQEMIMAQKKGVIKYADAICCPIAVTREGDADKANKPVTDDVDELKVRAVINSTNLMDRNEDVHIPGLWNKTLKENKNIMHLQEHEMRFASIIADNDDLKAYTQTMTWKELGFKYEGETQALVFDSIVKRDRNTFMFNQYKSGRVKNHSVGMQYVKVQMAIDDKDYPEEYKVWNKYIDQVANHEDAETKGYFFAVTEAKIIEGSAVPAGSNWATPTLENNMKSEPVKATPEEPDTSTQIDFIQELNRVKILI